MAGRGRGRGNLSFNAELLGIGRGDTPASVLAPPPKYPPRIGKPAPLLEGEEQDYLLGVSKEFSLHMRQSQFFLRRPGGLAPASSAAPSSANGASEAEKYSDKYENAPEKPLEVDWMRLPRELRPEYRKRMARKRKKVAAAGVRPNLNVARKDVTKTLEELEKREGKEGAESEDEDAGAGANKSKKDKDGDDEEDEHNKTKEDLEDLEMEEIDEEMDEGTDYANNYFDNGEGYGDDEDDNLDEGGIY